MMKLNKVILSALLVFSLYGCDNINEGTVGCNLDCGGKDLGKVFDDVIPDICKFPIIGDFMDCGKGGGKGGGKGKH